MPSDTIVDERSDREAQFALGVELLGRARSIEEAGRASALIEEASAAGHSLASETCALIECMGIGRPISWNKGLDWLALAATQGSDRAQQQLLLLAGVDRKAAAKADWGKIRSCLDGDMLVRPRDGIVATEKPLVQVFQAFASPAECCWLIEIARERLGPSTVFDYSTGGLRPDSRRTSSVALFTFEDVDLVIEMIRARISSTLGLPLRHFEVSQVLHYAPGQEFQPHHDYFDPTVKGFQEEIAKRGQRVATLLIYLNEEFEDGKTQFPSLGFSYRGEIGDAIAFFSVGQDGKPDPLTLHAGLPPTSGEKWIFSQWVRDRAPPG